MLTPLIVVCIKERASLWPLKSIDGTESGAQLGVECRCGLHPAVVESQFAVSVIDDDVGTSQPGTQRSPSVVIAHRKPEQGGMPAARAAAVSRTAFGTHYALDAVAT